MMNTLTCTVTFHFKRDAKTGARYIRDTFGLPAEVDKTNGYRVIFSAPDKVTAARIALSQGGKQREWSYKETPQAVGITATPNLPTAKRYTTAEAESAGVHVSTAEAEGFSGEGVIARAVFLKRKMARKLNARSRARSIRRENGAITGSTYRNQCRASWKN